jgi:transketolase
MNKHRHIQLELRKKILELHYQAKAGHISCSLSCIDILIAVLIFHKSERDSFILSKGHAASALYASLNHLGEISDSELRTFYKNGTMLSAHPAPLKFKSVPFATGSLGHGFPLGAGIATAKKLSNEEGVVYVVMSDGETNEGTTWEAAHFAVRHSLDNLVLIVDNNGLQGYGNLDDVLGNTTDRKKWEALHFEVMCVDGHDIEGIYECIAEMKKHKNGKPKVLVAKTVKGKGVSFMENKLEWHYLPMSEEMYSCALRQVTKQYS